MSQRKAKSKQSTQKASAKTGKVQLPPPVSDFIFKRLFGDEDSKSQLISLLNAVLGLTGDRRIKDISLLDPHLEREDSNDKKSILDIKARDQTQRILNIEIQARTQSAFPERILYYSSKLFASQFKKGEEYEELEPVISLVFTNFSMHLQQPYVYHHRYQLLDPETQNCLTKHLTIHIIELPKFEVSKNKKPKAKNALRGMALFSQGGTENESCRHQSME